MDIKDKKLIRNAILIFGIVAVLLGAVIVANKVITGNAIKEQQNQLAEYQKWLVENCECLEQNHSVCTLEGFEYNQTRNLCVNYGKKLVTYPGLACSKYDCSGEMKIWNDEIEMWEDIINE